MGENTAENGCRALAQNGHGLGVGYLLFCIRISGEKSGRASIQLSKDLEC